MSAATIETPVYDRTARKAHQWTMVALVAASLILQGVAGTLLLTVAGVIMLAGRFWWPADVVRQMGWRRSAAPPGHNPNCALKVGPSTTVNTARGGPIVETIATMLLVRFQRYSQIGTPLLS